MIAPNLNQRQQSLLALGILVAVLLLFYVVIIMPVLEKRSAFHEKLDELQLQNTHFANLISQRGLIMEDLARLRQEQTSMPEFLEDKTEALAAADLQNKVKTIIESHDGNLISTQVLQRENSGTFPEIRISIHVSASLEKLRNVIYTLESGTPTLLIDNLNMQKRYTSMARRSGPMPGAEAVEDLIEARLEVIGYIYRAETEE
jgi:general secretion pathway protein M